MHGKNVFVHIGTHKTGSTSLQYYLHDHKDVLRQFGFDFYTGLLGPVNHLELFLATMRYDRDSFAKIKMKIETNAEYTAEVQSYVRGYFEEAKEDNVILTTEGLSLLRHEDEVERLYRILNADVNSVKVIVYLRNKADFLKSFKAQILKLPGREFSSDPNSPAYVEDDTWLVDWETLISVYESGFGKENIHVIDYDAVVAEESTIIPSFMRLLDLPIEKFGDLDDYYRNKT